jgi:hypothetical protein
LRHFGLSIDEIWGKHDVNVNFFLAPENRIGQKHLEQARRIAARHLGDCA